MDCLVTYEYRGCQSSATVNEVTENDWFEAFRSKYNYDKILSHILVKQNTKTKMDCMIIYIYRGIQSSATVSEVTENDWFDAFRSRYNYDSILSHMFIK